MSFDPREFRNALGRFATGVCVITAKPEDHHAFGMTVNSFASVSLEPPLVLWSLQKNSDCFALFERVTHFTVNVLSEDQQAESNQYAKKGDHALTEGSYRMGKSTSPVLKGAMTSFECEMDAVHDGGDHIIIVGKVVELSDHPAEKSPLVFFQGKYRELK
jgi:flavin reductase (DIM6/NTAB) family NADH-FMN oxidoreductase RutF